MIRVAMEARVIAPYRRLKFHSFGDRSIIHRPDWIYGPHQIAVGAGVVSLGHIWLSAERETWGDAHPAITIGDGVGIRPYCTISAAEGIVIEDNVVISSFSTITDSDHTWESGHENVIWSPTVASPIRIGRGTWIGERSAILRGAQIGKFCKIGANSVVKGEIPDYSVAVGAPAKVVGSTRSEAPDQA